MTKFFLGLKSFCDLFFPVQEGSLAEEGGGEVGFLGGDWTCEGGQGGGAVEEDPILLVTLYCGNLDYR